MTKNLQDRLSRYGIDEFDEVIEVDDIDVGAELEKQKNLEYGYDWDDTQDYRVITRVANYENGGSSSLKKRWQNNRDEMIEQCKKSGKKVHTNKLGCFSLTKDELSSAGKKGYNAGIGKLTREQKLANIQKANDARMKNRKFSKEQVLYFRSVFQPRHPKYNCKALADAHGISDAAMRGIIKGRSYKDY
jgi:hypothetical protein